MQVVSYLILLFGICFKINLLVPFGLYLFEFTFTLSVGGVLYVYVVEILPEEVVPIATIPNWFCNILISRFTLPLVNKFDIYPIFMFFYFCSLTGFFIVNVFAVETKNKDEKEIIEEFRDKKCC